MQAVRLFASGLTAIALGSVALAGGVVAIQPTGTFYFDDVQSAVTASTDGSVILIGPGDYPGFIVNFRSLVIAAAVPGTVTIHGEVSIGNIDTSRSVVLSGLDVIGNSVTSYSTLFVSCAGFVRVQDCVFSISDATPGFCGVPPETGHTAVNIVDCPRLAFSSCTFIGGKGGDFDSTDDCHCHPPGDGGPGLWLSGSIVALYDCVLTGGMGGGSECTPGTGGPGALLALSTVFASNCQFTGGRGGSNFFAPPSQPGGTGGDGAAIGSFTLTEIGSTFTGGPGGFGGTTGPTGSPWTGVAPVHMPGPARTAVIGPYVSGDLAAWQVAFHGSPTDNVYAIGSPTPSSQISLPFHGAWLANRSNLLPIVTLGHADGSGYLSASVTNGDLPPGSMPQTIYGQIATRSAGSVYLGSPAVLVVIDRDSGPDCDANGVNDLVEVIEGAVPDANHNLIPDGCPGG